MKRFERSNGVENKGTGEARHDHSRESAPTKLLALKDQIRAICRDKLALQIDSDDEDLFDTGVLDSMSLVQLVFELEQSFKTELVLGELDISSLKSIRDIANLIFVRIGDRSAGGVHLYSNGRVANA